MTSNEYLVQLLEEDMQACTARLERYEADYQKSLLEPDIVQTDFYLYRLAAWHQFLKSCNDQILEIHASAINLRPSVDMTEKALWRMRHYMERRRKERNSK